MCSNHRVASGDLPRWWAYPRACEHGHRWGPGQVIVGWMPCDCAAAVREPGHGHLWVRCRAAGCREIGYRREHTPLAGVGYRGGAQIGKAEQVSAVTQVVQDDLG